MGAGGGSAKWFFSILLAVVCCTTGLVAACSSHERGQRAARVNEDWMTARYSPGHRAHLDTGTRCSECHGTQKGELTSPSVESCVGCHDELPLHHGEPVERGRREPDGCQDCHEFAGSRNSRVIPFGVGGAPPGTFFGPRNCLRCHLTAQQDHQAVVTHQEKPCLECHRPHGQKELSSPGCPECHREVDLHHGSLSSDARALRQQCLDCHTAHGPARDAGLACTGCHGKEEPRVPASATFSGGHESCVDCHQSHDLRAAASSSCKDCHEQYAALASAFVPAHQSCTNCHNQHDVKQAAHDACRECHQSVRTDHPISQGARGSCVTCHRPHPGPVGQRRSVVKRCAECHEKAGEDGGHGNSRVDCQACHSPHYFIASAQSDRLCATCHLSASSAVVETSAHEDCGQCHQGLPHHPSANAGNCEGCHSEHRWATRSHEACTTCHEPHSGVSSTCAECHRLEYSTAPAGHRRCTECHGPHQKDLEKPLRQCASCHREKLSGSPHRNLSSGCATCHRPHGPSGTAGPPGPRRPPACTSCHDEVPAPSLHEESGHQDCGVCHDAHDQRPRRDRATCVGCHRAQVDHQPGAENCTSCHLFRSSGG